MEVAQSTKNHGDKWGVILYLQWSIYTSIQTWTSPKKFIESSRSTKFKDTPMVYLSNIHEDHLNQLKNSHKLCNTMYLCNRVLSDKRKITPQKEIAGINWVIHLSPVEQEFQESLVQGKIHIHRNSKEDLECW